MVGTPVETFSRVWGSAYMAFIGFLISMLQFPIGLHRKLSGEDYKRQAMNKTGQKAKASILVLWKCHRLLPATTV